MVPSNEPEVTPVTKLITRSTVKLPVRATEPASAARNGVGFHNKGEMMPFPTLRRRCARHIQLDNTKLNLNPEAP